MIVGSIVVEQIMNIMNILQFLRTTLYLVLKKFWKGEL